MELLDELLLLPLVDMLERDDGEDVEDDDSDEVELLEDVDENDEDDTSADDEDEEDENSTDEDELDELLPLVEMLDSDEDVDDTDVDEAELLDDDSEEDDDVPTLDDDDDDDDEEEDEEDSELEDDDDDDENSTELGDDEDRLDEELLLLLLDVDVLENCSVSEICSEKPRRAVPVSVALKLTRRPVGWNESKAATNLADPLWAGTLIAVLSDRLCELAVAAPTSMPSELQYAFTPSMTPIPNNPASASVSAVSSAASPLIKSKAKIGSIPLVTSWVPVAVGVAKEPTHASKSGISMAR